MLRVVVCVGFASARPRRRLKVSAPAQLNVEASLIRIGFGLLCSIAKTRSPKE